MSECNINSLTPSSKSWVAVLVVLGLVGGGVIGGFVGNYIGTEGVTSEYTEIHVTVSEDFTLEMLYVIPLEEVEWSCSLLNVGGQFFENSFFDATMDWLEEDTSRVFDESTIMDDLGIDEAQMGLHFELISDEVMGWDASPDSNLNGGTYTISFGKSAALMYVSVGVYVSDVLEVYDFSLEGSNEFVEAMDCTMANYSVFSNANFLRGQNTMLINGLTIVEEGMLLDVETSLNVTFNGADILMPLSVFAFP